MKNYKDYINEAADNLNEADNHRTYLDKANKALKRKDWMNAAGHLEGWGEMNHSKLDKDQYNTWNSVVSKLENWHKNDTKPSSKELSGISAEISSLWTDLDEAIDYDFKTSKSKYNSKQDFKTMKTAVKDIVKYIKDIEKFYNSKKDTIKDLDTYEGMIYALGEELEDLAANFEMQKDNTKNISLVKNQDTTD